MSTNKPLDVLALAAHPDDVELSAGGTMCLLAAQGRRTGIVDFTRGERGSRGTPALRAQEAENAASILGVQARENLGLPDGNIANTPENQAPLIRCIRQYRPHIVLIGAPTCRHPDHGDATRLAVSALFSAGLRKVETHDTDGTVQAPWRPSHVLHYMQTLSFDPTLVVDVSAVWAQRMAALRAYTSQFDHPDYRPNPDEPDTFISTPAFIEWVTARARMYGYRIGAQYAEPFLVHNGPFGTDDLYQVFSRKQLY